MKQLYKILQWFLVLVTMTWLPLTSTCNEKVNQTENLHQEESLIIDKMKDDVMSFWDFYMSNLTET